MAAADYWMQMAERVGIPMTILFFFGMAVWLSLRWLAKRIFEPIAKSHVDLVDEVRKSSSRNSETLTKIAEVLELKVTMLGNMEKTTAQIVPMVTANTKRLDSMRHDVIAATAAATAATTAATAATAAAVAATAAVTKTVPAMG
jgi:hypothetical protein